MQAAELSGEFKQSGKIKESFQFSKEEGPLCRGDGVPDLTTTKGPGELAFIGGTLQEIELRSPLRT